MMSRSIPGPAPSRKPAHGDEAIAATRAPATLHRRRAVPGPDAAIIAAAQAILIEARNYREQHAFEELIDAAQQQHFSVVALARALVDLAGRDPDGRGDDLLGAAAAAYRQWSGLLATVPARGTTPGPHATTPGPTTPRATTPRPTTPRPTTLSVVRDQAAG